MSNVILATRLSVACLLLIATVMIGCSDDELAPVPVAPVSSPLGVPDIIVDPLQHSFADIIVNQQSSVTFTVGNVGGADLFIANVVIRGQNPGAFAVVGDTVSGRALMPNEVGQGITVAFLPTETMAYAATLEIYSNDPDESPLLIPLDGGGHSTGPIALCNVTPTALTLPSGTAAWDGSASYDPDGLALVSFTWQLSTRPSGSAAVLPGCQNSALCPGFAPDVAGIYTASLTVTNVAGVSATCRADLEVHAQDHPPIAACDVDPPTIDLLALLPATWLGSGSSDPDGDALTAFSWTLQARPSGSGVLMPACTAADCGPFVPDVPGVYTAQLRVTSATGLRDDCTATLTVTQSGQGPVAVCDVDPDMVNPPFESATFDGSGSYDPDGYALVRHTWTLLSQPAGSASTLPACGNSPICGPLAPDIAGIYTGQLTVENSLGMTASCTVDLDSVPRQDLWIEMYWTHSGDDMDLHVVRPGGTLRSTGDCYFMNCVGGGPDWGQSGVGTDDPSLDLDDISGTGPENVNINSPAAGAYTVVVHDYPGSSYTSANDVTINIYIDGVIVYTDTRTITGEDSDTSFCSIDWPSGTVTPL